MRLVIAFTKQLFSTQDFLIKFHDTEGTINARVLISIFVTVSFTGDLL